MNYFFGRPGDPLRALRRSSSVLWLFDFDGTLSPIARRPEFAVLPAGAKRSLRALARRFPGRVGVLSGRRLHSLKQKVGIPELLYGAVHGFEMQGPRFRWEYPVPAARIKRLQRFAGAWRGKLEAVPGLWMENKKWSFCMHHGEVKRRDWAQARRLLTKLEREALKKGFRTQEGLNSLEILCSAKWNKGMAALWLKKRSGCNAAFYAGDDATDETVFRVLHAPDVGVRIGRSRTSRARYFLKNQSESQRLLREILTR